MKKKDIITQEGITVVRRNVIDTWKYRNNKSDSINNKISHNVLKEIGNHFCKDITVNNKYNLTNQPIINTN